MLECSTFFLVLIKRSLCIILFVKKTKNYEKYSIFYDLFGGFKKYSYLCRLNIMRT